MLDGKTDGATGGNGPGELGLALDLEIEELEDSLDRQAIEALKPESVMASLSDKVSSTLNLPSEELAGPVKENLSYVTDYIFNNMGIRDPQEVIAAVIKLVDWSGVKTTEPQWMLQGVVNFLETVREIQAMKNTNEYRSAQGNFATV